MGKRKAQKSTEEARHEQRNGKSLSETLADRGWTLLCMVTDAELKYWPYAAVNQETLERRFFANRREIEAFATAEPQHISIVEQGNGIL